MVAVPLVVSHTKSVAVDILVLIPRSIPILVPAIRKTVHSWRLDGYAGATDTSKRLLQYWFETDHKTKRGVCRLFLLVHYV